MSSARILKFLYKLSCNVVPHFLAAAIFLVGHVGIALKINQPIHGESLLKGLNKLWLIIFD
jgi:hypothetical protein